jgi:Arf-GAP/coiled-coil/ANK repeat/PH domain-containing protein
MNDVLATKRFEFLERMEVYMHAQMTYFHQGYECFKDLEPSMKSYASHLQATRHRFEDDRKKTRERRAELEANPSVARLPAQQLSQTVKRGYLFKRSEDVINTWSKRYFVLQDNQLCAYKNGKDQQPDLVLQLLLYTVKSRDDIDRRNCFELVSPPDKSVILQAENEESKQEWIQAIQGCISSLLNAQPSHEEKHSRKATPLDGASDNAVACAELKQLNPICADCDSKDPEWASINLGALLCIDCSGTHRSMGVHISKVRSLTLDAWDTDLIELAIKLGNKKVNEVFEAQVPPDRQKPTSSASWEIRQKWIRDKYEGKKFVKPSYSFPVEMHTALLEAITNDDLTAILRLYAQGIDLNYQYPANNRRTPLHLAVAANRPIVVLFLLLNAADPAVKDEFGWTPLHLAADLALANCAIPLLQKNSVHILSFTDKNNRTPLDIAVGNGGADCVTLFRLAQLAREESGNVSYEESFAQALKMFSKDARTKN